MSMSLTIDTSRLVILADGMRANVKQMEAARLRALNKTMSWLRTRTVRVVSNEARIASRLVRQRVAAFRATNRNRSAKVWAGLDPIKAYRLGKSSVSRGGVRVGRHSFPGAFVAQTQSGHTGIFKRTGEAKRLMQSGRYAGSQTRREPIEEVEADIFSDRLSEEIDKVFGMFNERFIQLYVRELKYQVFVKNAR